MAAHLRIPSTPQAAIFSPSVARAAASTAKDWAYVDDWLRSKYALLKRRPPPFERNPETLRALLALAAANEAADEERQQLARVEEAALEEVRRAAEHEAQAAERRQRREDAKGEEDEDEPTIDGALLASDLLHAVDDALSREGRTALDAMADVAVELGIAPQASSSSSSSSSTTPSISSTLTPESLGLRFVELQGSAYDIDQAAHRVDMLRRYLDAESARTTALLSSLRALDLTSNPSSGSTPEPPSSTSPTDLARQNLETQRRIRAASSRLPELRQQITAFSRTIIAGDANPTNPTLNPSHKKNPSVTAPGPGPGTTYPPLTVEDVRHDEESYLALLSRKRDLDARVRAFAGLPPDVGAARAELERLREELRRATDARDANFESLVERESPVKSGGGATRRAGGGSRY
ncbi:hypothetical protein F4810DRAFT_471499 [Camillea tinctor]|nr:hypothetical protein F4810DRAFT_471499 [Camillea tinctor]